VGNHKGFRGWYYLRIGWSTYFAFIFAVVNTSVVTYYLAIEKAPFLQTIFPSFLSYVGILSAIGVPLLIIAGYIHFQRSHAYGSEAEIATETNPYFYKAAPGWSRQVMFPVFLKITELLLKVSNNQKLTDDELKELKELQDKIKLLMEGESIGTPRKPFSDDSDISRPS
tara:strand:+ start:195 stop:701 length:507 start_codon:yes stop_codon:yes gene_type:complete